MSADIPRDLTETVARAMKETARWADDEVMEGRMNAWGWWMQLAHAAITTLSPCIAEHFSGCSVLSHSPTDAPLATIHHRHRADIEGGQ